MSTQMNTRAENRKTASSRDDAYWEAMRGHAERLYADAVADNETAARAAVDQAAEKARQQSQELAAGFRGLDKQLYRDYMAQRRTLPQTLAARGYTGGMNESGRIRLQNSYQESLAENARRRIAEEAKIEQTRAGEELSARNAVREANARANAQRTERLADLRTRQYTQQRSDDLRRAQELAKAGDYSGYRALGYSESEISYLSRVWAARNPKLQDVWSYGHYA